MSSSSSDARLLARSSPAGFAWHASGGAWIPAPHLRLLSRKLVDVATGRTPRLMVFMPPRHGKSELISKYTPAWFLGRFPDRKVMLASYADTFAATWGRAARDILEEHGPRLFGVRVSGEAKGGSQWEVDPASPALRSTPSQGAERGVMVTAGVGGGLTGKGAHLMVIDDPVKNAEEAQSERTRDAHHDWWRSTARTRLQKGAGVVLVMTRWHEDDLAGRLLADARNDDGDQWEVLCLPGFAEKTEFHPATDTNPNGDPLGRAEGAPLWPAMFDTPMLEQTRRAMGSYWFSAMYQQRPAPADGMFFRREHFRYFSRDLDRPTEDGSYVCTLHSDSGERVFDTGFGRKIMTVDVAGTSKTTSDFTVAATWLVTPERDLLLWDLERVQFEGPDLVPFIRRIYAEQRPSIIGVERLGFGLTLIQELLREGLPVVRLEPDTDKVSRALPAAARIEEHRVFFPRGASFVPDFEHELLSFPNAAHDDQVDVLAYAALQLPGIHTAHGPAGQFRVRGARGMLTGGLMDRQL